MRYEGLVACLEEEAWFMAFVGQFDFLIAGLECNGLF